MLINEFSAQQFDLWSSKWAKRERERYLDQRNVIKGFWLERMIQIPKGNFFFFKKTEHKEQKLLEKNKIHRMIAIENLKNKEYWLSGANSLIYCIDLENDY